MKSSTRLPNLGAMTLSNRLADSVLDDSPSMRSFACRLRYAVLPHSLIRQVGPLVTPFLSSLLSSFDKDSRVFFFSLIGSNY